MILTLDADQLKSVSGVETGDTAAEDLLSAISHELQPVLEGSVSPEALADATLQPVLSLAFSEVVAGEFFARQVRKNAVFETIAVGPVRISPPASFLDPTGLVARGYARLRPYLKPEAFAGAGTVRTGGTQ